MIIKKTKKHFNSVKAYGFEYYITGYPLSENSYYALAKTWYANEMERPGCVWTHTLLIKFSDLAYVNNLPYILTLFQRPSSKKDFKLYSKPLEISEIQIKENLIDVNKLNEKEIRTILLNLYNNNGVHPVFICGNDSKKYEKAIICVWNQQWPKLRRSFSFCSGSLSNRRINGISLDLQIIPEKMLYVLKRENFENISTGNEINNDLSALSLIDQWWQELFIKNNSSLKKFIWKYGLDTVNGKIAFIYLTELFPYI